MERKVISDKTRLRWVILVMGAMLAAGTVVDWADHETFRFWLKSTLAPLTVGGSIAILVVSLAMRARKRVLKMPEGF
jgi:hypothetical protein